MWQAASSGSLASLIAHSAPRGRACICVCLFVCVCVIVLLWIYARETLGDGEILFVYRRGWWRDFGGRVVWIAKEEG